MPRTFVLKLNLDRLRQQLSREEGRPISMDELHHWLRDAGFRQTANGWEIEERHLGQLLPSEVLDATVREENPPGDST